MVLLGLFFRLVWGLLVPVEPVSDSVVYARTAENIALHGVYGVEPDKPFSYWPVGAAAVYALGYKLFGISSTVVVLLNLIASVALIYTSGLLACRWFDKKTALVTVGILACWPSLIMYVTIFASEIFFALFCNLALLAWRMETRRWVLRAVITGVMIAAASYVRPVSLLLPFVLGGIEIILTKRVAQSVIAIFIVLVASAAVIAPWAVRNSQLHGGFVLISTNGGPNLWMGNNQDSTGSYMPLPEFTRKISEYERDKVLGAEAKEYMFENPGHTAIMFFRKLIDTHARETIAVHWNGPGLKDTLGGWVLIPFKFITQVYWVIVLMFALAGTAAVIRGACRQHSFLSATQSLVSPPLVYWLYFAVLHAVIVSQDRYHFPSIPFIAMLSAISINLVWSWLTAAMQEKQHAR